MLALFVAVFVAFGPVWGATINGTFVDEVSVSMSPKPANLISIQSSAVGLIALVRENGTSALLIRRTGERFQKLIDDTRLGQPLSVATSSPSATNLTFKYSQVSIGAGNLYFTTLTTTGGASFFAHNVNGAAWRLKNFQTPERVIAVGDQVTAQGFRGKVSHLSTVYAVGSREFIGLEIEDGRTGIFEIKIDGGLEPLVTTTDTKIRLEDVDEERVRRLFADATSLFYYEGKFETEWLRRVDVNTKQVSTLLEAGDTPFGERIVLKNKSFLIQDASNASKLYLVYNIHIQGSNSYGPAMTRVASWDETNGWRQLYRLNDGLPGGLDRLFTISGFAGSGDFGLMGVQVQLEEYPYSGFRPFPQVLALSRGPGSPWQVLVRNGDTVDGKIVGRLGRYYPTQACSGFFSTMEAMNGPFSALYEVSVPCLQTAVELDGQIVLQGFNLARPDVQTEVLISGRSVVPGFLGASELRVPSPGIGEVTLQVKLGTVVSNALSLQLSNRRPQFSSAGVVNAANFRPDPVSPGSIVSLFGTNLSSRLEQAVSLPLPATLADAQVLLDGRPTPLFFVSPGQINLQVPHNVVPGTSVSIQVATRMDGVSASSATVSIPVAAASPAAFEHKGRAIVTKDFQLVTRSNALSEREAFTVWMTGLGITLPIVPAGQSAPTTEPFARTYSTVVLTVGGVRAEVLFAGLAPGFAGLYQVNAVLPAGLPSNGNPAELPATVSVGDARAEFSVFVQ